MTRSEQATPRRFRIWIDGRLSRGFASSLDGVDQLDERTGTVLVGDFVDDAHLRGVLDHLRDLAIGIRRFEVDPHEGHTRSTEDRP